mgnify:CR=1 FL=1
MKVGYPDTINSGNSSATPFKMVDTSKADLDKDGKVSEYEGNRAEAAFGDTPINMNVPLKMKDKKAQAVRKADAKEAREALLKVKTPIPVPLKSRDKMKDKVPKRKITKSVRRKVGLPEEETSIPIKFANAAQRKAVWASKNEKKKKK